MAGNGPERQQSASGAIPAARQRDDDDPVFTVGNGSAIRPGLGARC
jgi:hypothetical protein